MSSHDNNLLRKGLFILLMGAASWLCLSGRHELHGDGLEYVVQTQAIALHGRLAIDCDALRDYWNATNPYDTPLSATRPPQRALSERAQAGGGWGGLYPDRFGVYRYCHFWAYSLAVAPLYGILHYTAGAPAEYLAFRIFNWLLLLTPFVAAWWRKRSWRLLALIALGLLSPLIPYTDWQHTELFCFNLVFFAFWMAGSPRWFRWSPLPLGLAAAQNIPIVLFFGLHLAYVWRAHRREIAASLPRLAAAYGAAGLLFAGSLFYWHYYFGHWTLIGALGAADLRYASLDRVRDLFLSPAVGAAWFYPTLFLVLPWLPRKQDWPWALPAGLTIVAVAYLASSTGNFNAGQVGSLRYAVWILAPCWYAMTQRAAEPGGWPRWRRTVLGILMILNLAIVFGLKHDRLIKKDTRRFEGSRRGVRETAALYAWLRYNDDPEILAETIRGEELPHLSYFRGVYLWTLTRRATLCLVARPESPGSVLAEWRASQPLRYRTYPAGNDVIRVTDGTAKLAAPAGATYRRHPYLGDYMLVWIEGAVRDPVGYVPLTVRNSITAAK